MSEIAPAAKRMARRPLSAGNRRGAMREAAAGYLFILPSLVGFTVFVFLPMLAIFVLAFMDYGISGQPMFNGLHNFLGIVNDPRTWTVYGNTLLFTIFAVSGNVLLGLAAAVFLNRKFPQLVRTLFRSAFFFPSLVGLVYVSIIWQYLYQKDVGVINYYLGLLGIDKIGWLSSSGWVLTSIVVMDVWKNFGMSMLILLAGLQGVPGSYLEAAKIDGAGALKSFINITLPLLSPILLFVITMNLTGALRVFDSIVVLTKGGPGDASRSIVMLIYEKAFQSYDFGYASALSVTLLLVIGVVTLFHFWASRRWVHYE
ncbi:carbohydrate ABC transporter permease [Paenibacillaceae bacterium WGS1546]|uniref:carbohydrate ABC transporter permease n=1 Tax=Cohnella sp. WGS1546 TaxID=3366810 RepID=UPI00372CFFC4